jgi:lipopolysaccharide-induced tumor necrosis factor-alpha factor
MAVELTPPNFGIELGEDPQKMVCYYCQDHIETELHHKVGSLALIMACVTMPCLVCWVPFVFNRFKDAKHFCPNCEKHLGMFVKF